jgi:hypothetical protein
MTRLVTNQRIGEALIKHDLLPPHCRFIDLRIGVRGALVIRYEVFVPVEDLGRFADALKDVHAALEAEP